MLEHPTCCHVDDLILTKTGRQPCKRAGLLVEESSLAWKGLGIPVN